MQQHNHSTSQYSDLSPNQLSLWLGQQHHPNAPIYNMVHAFSIHGPIIPERFQSAFQSLVDRADAMRLVINVVNGVPQQRVTAPFEYQVAFIDFSQHADSESKLETWLEKRSVQPFNLAECLFDSALVKVADEHFVWYYNHHHIACDILSIKLVYQYVAAIYKGLEQEGGLEETAQIPSYLARLEHARKLRPNDKAASFWQQKLADLPPANDFYGLTRATGTPEAERISVPLGEERSFKLSQLAENEDLRSLTPHLSRMNIFTAALSATLYRICGQERVVIGSPFHNRLTPADKETPGLFIQLYPLLVSINSSDTFRSLIPRIQNESLETLRYAPFINQRASGQSIDAATTFDVVLNYLTVQFDEFAGYPSQFRWIHAGYGDSNHAIRLQIHDFQNNGELTLYFDLNNGVFNDSAKVWIVRHFLTILDACLDNPDTQLVDIDMLTEVETQSYLVDFNNTDVNYPVDKTVVDLFETQVHLKPDVVAAVDGSQSLTYAQLDQRAETLAAYLHKQNIGAGQLVGLCTYRSLETLIGILAILKSGAAYVPIDPTYPTERIDQILDDIDTPVVLTHLDMDENAHSPRIRCKSLKIADFNTNHQSSTAENRPRNTDPAYVIFTSGSTGRPKGVMVSHRGLTNYAVWAAKNYAGDEALTFPLFSSLSFDLTVTSIFVPLITGGTIVIYREDSGTNDLAILRVLQENAVDIIKLTPAHLVLLNQVQKVPNRLRKMIVGGEDFKTQLALQTLQHFDGDIEIYNEYGPTEATVGCMIHRFDPSRDIGRSVPIGTPADNTQITIVDQYGKPVPTGVIGEMIVAGHGVAQGYLNRPELTSEKFVPSDTNRQWGRIAGLCYRTGDLARWLPSGQLEFLGRADHQVKLRGYRVELGEIEASLLNHPAVQEAVVTIIEPPAHESQVMTQAPSNHCARCGLPDTYPNAHFDDNNICHLCRRYETYADKVHDYFHSNDELIQVAARIKADKQGTHDCIMLMSGGKDSTYVLYQLVQLGLNPLVFTLDNGYISEQAKGNILRVVEHLGLENVFETTPHMNEIFVDSLKRYCNVCNGCFKTIYTLSMKLARERNIKFIVTGLARGQLFETRLTEELFLAPNFDANHIDQQILDARKAYHRQQDLIAEKLNGSIFVDDTIFNEIEFIDFYRYTDVELSEMLAFLAQNAPWIRPEDTGRSTNCLINDVGIYVHKTKRGYHNYALPYSWDVRLGHKERDAALHELDDEIDETEVQKILTEIGYDLDELKLRNLGEPRLVAYYTANAKLPSSEIREYLARLLPVYMVPTDFMALAEMPLTANGKIDRTRLPQPPIPTDESNGEDTLPETELEIGIAQIWEEALYRPITNINLNFFDIGGTSLPAIQIVARISQQYNIDFPLHDFFAEPTVSQLSQRVEDIIIAEIEALTDEEAKAQLI